MSDNGKAEAIATAGLFLNLIAVIAVTVCLASWGASHATTAAMTGVVAVVSFTVSIACFRAQADEPVSQEVAVS
jgi:F0F1-type ATP synthase assembly protein I